MSSTSFSTGFKSICYHLLLYSWSIQWASVFSSWLIPIWLLPALAHYHLLYISTLQMKNMFRRLKVLMEFGRVPAFLRTFCIILLPKRNQSKELNWSPSPHTLWKQWRELDNNSKQQELTFCLQGGARSGGCYSLPTASHLLLLEHRELLCENYFLILIRPDSHICRRK